jgi:hypothetical protein
MTERDHSSVTTRFPTEADLEISKIKQLSDLINAVYDDAESGMWKRKGTRTNPGEVARLLSNQALILAELDGRLVGAVNVNLMNDGIGEFGMLVADRNHRGKGIGSALADAPADARTMDRRPDRPRHGLTRGASPPASCERQRRRAGSEGGAGLTPML